MIIDYATEVSSAQVLASGAAVSTNSVDLKAAARVRGNGSAVKFNVNISSVSGTTPTLAVEVIGADDAALTSNVVSLGRIDPAVATGMAAKNVQVEADLLTKKRYVGLRYTMGGTTPAATVTSAVCGTPAQADYQQ